MHYQSEDISVQLNILYDNITDIENAGISSKQFSNDDVALLKINTPMGKYGVAVQFANGNNQISTAFKSTDKGIDDWIKRGSANSITSEPLSSRDDTHTVAVVGRNPDNIIKHIKGKLKGSAGIYSSKGAIPSGTKTSFSDTRPDEKKSSKVLAASEVSPNGQSFDTPSTNISITDIKKLYNPDTYHQGKDKKKKSLSSDYAESRSLKEPERDTDIITNPDTDFKNDCNGKRVASAWIRLFVR